MANPGGQLGRGATYRVVLLGELGVGKTSLFRRIKDNTFDQQQPATSGIDSCSKYITVDGEEIVIGVWDTAGVERFRTLTRNYYRNADVAVYVYSVTDTASLHYLSQWLKDTQQHAPDALKVMVGNKIDLESNVEVEDSVAQAFADLNNIKHVYRISCKTNSGVEELLTSVSKAVHRQRSSSPEGETDRGDIVDISAQDRKENERGCAC